jgi:uncharacterized protein
MMQKIILIFIFIISSFFSFAQQNAYADSLKSYINNYIQTHDVINGDDKKYFCFFPADELYCVKAKFKKIINGQWFQMETSGRIKKAFRVYGVAEFSIHDTALTLNIYQSQNLMQDTQYNDYLFLPFTDLTTGIESYHTGRYIDFTIKDIKNRELTIDFNKAYNPSCAYVSGKYNCPVPPKENNLPIAIKAGEMNFGKKE